MIGDLGNAEWPGHRDEDFLKHNEECEEEGQ